MKQNKVTTNLGGDFASATGAMTISAKAMIIRMSHRPYILVFLTSRRLRMHRKNSMPLTSF